MDYTKILKNFTIDLNTTLKDNVGFYDIWDFKGYILQLEKEYEKLPLSVKEEYEKILEKLKNRIDHINSFDKNDPLVKKEIEFLKDFCNKKLKDMHIELFKVA